MSRLTSGQQQYARTLAGLTGLNTRVIQAWLLSEESGGAASQRERQGNHNWLNIGPGRVYSSPEQGARAAAKVLHNGMYQGVLAAARGGSVDAQISALVKSPWDAGHYRGGAGLRQLVGEVGGLHGVRQATDGAQTAQGAAQTAPGGVPQGSEGIATLLQALTGAQQPAGSSVGVQAPAFSAQPVLPAGAQLPSSGGGPAPRPDVSALLEAVRTIGAGAPSSAQPGQPAPAGAGGSGGGGAVGSVGPGSVRFAPNAEVGLTPGIKKVLGAVAGQYGHPVTVGTGKLGHSTYTVGGNVSEHASGNAGDIPATGETLIREGQAALIAAGMDPRKARQQRGGLFNIPYGRNRRIQVIFNTSGPGIGDHTDHVHVGVTPLRRR